MMRAITMNGANTKRNGKAVTRVFMIASPEWIDETCFATPEVFLVMTANW